MSAATGSRGAAAFVPAAGRSSTPIRIIPTSTIRLLSPWRWIASKNFAGRKDFDTSLARAREWILGMQSENGAWGAFDADNEYYYLNNIPFADHGALLDPPTEDVTARCLSMLAQFGETIENSQAVARGVDYLRRTQLAEGSWYGRWGMNYIYGTWSVAVRAQCRRPRSPRAGNAQGGGLAHRRSRTTTAAGARMARAISSTIAATSPRRRRRHRRLGRCLA